MNTPQQFSLRSILRTVILANPILNIFILLEAFDEAASPGLYDPEALRELQCPKIRKQIDAKINKYW